MLICALTGLLTPLNGVPYTYLIVRFLFIRKANVKENTLEYLNVKNKIIIIVTLINIVSTLVEIILISYKLLKILSSIFTFPKDKFLLFAIDIIEPVIIKITEIIKNIKFVRKQQSLHLINSWYSSLILYLQRKYNKNIKVINNPINPGKQTK